MQDALHDARRELGQDKPSQMAIGLFVATFVHAILAIREVTPAGDGAAAAVEATVDREDVPLRALPGNFRVRHSAS